MIPVLLLLPLLVPVLQAAPARIITYNQTQIGEKNIFADVENVLILIVPSKGLVNTAVNLIDLRRSVPEFLRSNLPEIAHDTQEVDKITVPEPPEPAEPEKVTKPPVVKETPVTETTGKEKPPTKQKEQHVKPTEQPLALPSKDTTVSSRGRHPAVSAKLLGFGVSPAQE